MNRHHTFLTINMVKGCQEQRGSSQRGGVHSMGRSPTGHTEAETEVWVGYTWLLPAVT